MSFSLKACITLSDIQLLPTSIDFGTCTVYESVVYTVDVSNKSCTPLEFGFINLPKVIDLIVHTKLITIIIYEKHNFFYMYTMIYEKFNAHM